MSTESAKRPVRIAVNGYGRIGKNVLRAWYERPELHDAIEFVAINDLGDLELNAHLTRYDSVHGRFNEAVSIEGDKLVIGERAYPCFSKTDPADLPWGDLGVDIVFECTGRFKDRDKAMKHINAGASKVLVSAPAKGADATVVYGINDEVLTPEHQIVSNASCTTNCLAPVVKPLYEALGIEHGLMTTIHAYTNDQNLSDVYHSDPFRARAAAQNMIPTKTGAAAAIGLVMPELAGKLDGLAVRVPTINVSLVDLTLHVSRETSVEEVNSIMQVAAEADTQGVLAYNNRPLVSIDFNHTTTSSNFDANHTRVIGSMVNVLSWYDNEWGFCNRMLDTAMAMMAKS